MEELLTNGGTVGIIVIAVALLLRLILDFWRKGGGMAGQDTDAAAELVLLLREIREDTKATRTDTAHLRVQHDHFDDDGVPRWHLREEFKDAVRTMADSLPKLQRLLEKMDERLAKLEECE